MKNYRVDLHIHTVLSPCANLQMSPDVIVERALEQQLDIIGIADHNSTKQCEVIRQMGHEVGLTVLCGAEINTKEEVHCLTFFEDSNQLNQFQQYLDTHLPRIKNKPELFGDQVWVDKDNNILGEELRLLIVGLDASIDEVNRKVAELGGLFIPAHVDKPRNSISSQLGFLPGNLTVSGVELSANANMEAFKNKHPWIKKYSLITNSDAHIPEQIGSSYTIMQLQESSFNEVKMALKNETGRRVLSIMKKGERYGV
ncbi:hypothetical protein SAMN06265379_106150 [Saccharicrinis carchari]|uniref:Polymerase/histidinol phosphatase N-terminal domain-containing protein n=1 Tax=Saccharicrinis carchari TaxID=1168039 RepID=A0A521DTL5_SACCC|nr:PHP domain-containing protein [Saccharicrinis carchari]SMO74965.1 hypothetical protein SAMN06265379_106150 [Saccharicrinis carchari]